MENLISKELLSKVLDNEVPYQIEVHKIIIKNNSLNYYYNSKDSRGGLFEANEYINIYELAHKCKEWAINKGYEIKSSKPIVSNDKGRQVFNYWWAAWLFKFDGGCESPKQILLPSFIGENEPKAIFKACQWILDNKESK